MFIEAPRFPDEIAYGARGGPLYSTSVVATIDHTEQRNQNWRVPLARYEVGLINRDQALTEQLFAFFRTIAQGRTNGFRFHDFLPGEGDMTQEVIAVGDGTTQTFQLVKPYTSGGILVRRVLSKPVAGTVALWSGDPPVALTGYSVNTQRGLVTLAAPLGAGVPLRASCQFDVPVRFDTDRLPLQRVDPKAWSWGSIRLVETRNVL